ncbi:aspartyl protease [Scytonema sp. UIC 10036]|uniref:aspartyl protease n=1 Tax=Scytonema sp. UIC 10036 TaxID=2304196 RepID=UPI0012DAF52E|nr:aspartyl protease [Scytonema sp. UIC 10036]MUG91790.1 aspartyl protease [Scytonema sp. UIC 10036]
MISGFFGVEDALFFEIDLIVSSGFDLPVNAMFDTGFSGYLAINGQDIDGFGWTYIKQQPMFTARGETEFDLYLGEVRIDGQEFQIPVHVGSYLTEVLLGRQWLTTRRLVIDMPSGVLTLG